MGDSLAFPRDTLVLRSMSTVGPFARVRASRAKQVKLLAEREERQREEDGRIKEFFKQRTAEVGAAVLTLRAITGEGECSRLRTFLSHCHRFFDAGARQPLSRLVTYQAPIVYQVLFKLSRKQMNSLEEITLLSPQQPILWDPPASMKRLSISAPTDQNRNAHLLLYRAVDMFAIAAAGALALGVRICTLTM